MECQLYFAEVPQKRESTVAGMKGTRKEWESVPDPTKHIRNVKKIFSPIVKKIKIKKLRMQQQKTEQQQRGSSRQQRAAVDSSG
jgi:hypothetical protein